MTALGKRCQLLTMVVLVVGTCVACASEPYVPAYPKDSVQAPAATGAACSSQKECPNSDCIMDPCILAPCTVGHCRQ